MFLKPKVNIGRVRQGSTTIVNFPYEGIKEIVTMVSGCGCGLPYDNAANSKVWVQYTAGKIDHLDVDSVKMEKTVDVTYINDNGLAHSEQLVFEVVVFKKF